MAIGTPSAALVAAMHCINCNKVEDHVRIRKVTEPVTGAEQRRSVCAHCAGGMLEMGCTVDPFTARDRFEYERWINAPRHVLTPTRERLQEGLDGMA